MGFLKLHDPYLRILFSGGLEDLWFSESLRSSISNSNANSSMPVAHMRGMFSQMPISKYSYQLRCFYEDGWFLSSEFKDPSMILFCSMLDIFLTVLPCYQDPVSYLFYFSSTIIFLISDVLQIPILSISCFM